MSAPGTPALQVLAVLDDAAAGSVALELSSTLARALQRSLAVVYVESAASLIAAELPFTQVLGPTASQWQPLRPGDVEQGFRAQAARLRVLASRIAARHAVGWSLRVVRGNLSSVAITLWAESDLLLLSPAPPSTPPALGPPRQARRRPVVSVVVDAGDSGQRALGVATELAKALDGALESTPAETLAARAAHIDPFGPLARSDVLVLPRGLAEPGMLARLRCPVLLVG